MKEAGAGKIAVVFGNERTGLTDEELDCCSLAINIPIMGFILVEGVRSSLQANLPPGTDMNALQLLAEKVAAGTAGSSGQGSRCGESC